MKTVGTGTRVLNFLIDTFLIFIIALVFSNWYSFQVMYWGYKPLPPYSFFFITLVVYYFLFESIWRRTPGKWLSISKVVKSNGQKPSIGQIFLRSLIRVIVIDFLFIPFLDGKTLHDYLSGTIVIEA
ncbi:RDD family protein [Arachidicoccus sp.]|jgi:uncharacterized RDD family membrane protein YckC|uniref:RDD family protein n=1 Tax=Arachidicoccus sp. TaxID=1872624 RepID=UPI003D21E58E